MSCARLLFIGSSDDTALALSLKTTCFVYSGAWVRAPIGLLDNWKHHIMMRRVRGHVWCLSLDILRTLISLDVFSYVVPWGCEHKPIFEKSGYRKESEPLTKPLPVPSSHSQRRIRDSGPRSRIKKGRLNNIEHFVHLL